MTTMYRYCWYHEYTHDCSVEEELIKAIKQPINKKLSLPKVNPKSIFITPTNVDEICVIIQNMNTKKAGVDNIHANTLKQLTIYITKELE